MQTFLLAYDLQYLEVIRLNLKYLLCYPACRSQQNNNFHTSSSVDMFKDITVPCVTVHNLIDGKVFLLT